MILKISHHGKGNRKAQQKRRREREKNRPAYQPIKVELIDGNFSHFPRAFCKSHNAFLTDGLINTHKCLQKACKGFLMLQEGDFEWIK